MKIKFQNITIIILILISLGNIEAGSRKIYNSNFSDSLIVDTTGIAMNLDSLVIDSLKIDTTAEESSKKKLQAPIYYWTDKGDVSRKDNVIFLKGNAKIVYQNMTLEAEKIMVDQDNHFLYAEGAIDTIDSLGNPVYSGLPVFTEKGEEPIYGNTLYYDFNTKRGKIGLGKTKMPPGFYKGEKIHKISPQTLLVQDGYFTSCEYIDDPHFYFRSDKMRVVVKDRVIAKPVYFYIADVPLFVLPFGVFPNKRGRHSGIIVPSYGESNFGGRFLKDIGYYWAPSDYVDATFLADFYDRRGFAYKGDLNYALRYLLSGSVSGYYFPRDLNTGEKRQRWAVNFNHSHTIDPTLRISASGKFQSDKQIEREFSSNIDRRLNQIITSNMTVSKNWKGTKNSMSMNISRTENLQNGNLSYTLPNLRFSRSTATLYETITGEPVRGKVSWYQNINFSYNSRLIHKGDKTLRYADTDSAHFERSQSQGAEHNASFNAPQKIFKYFNLNPSIGYKEIWVDEITTAYLDTVSGKIATKKEKQFAIRRTFNSSLSFRTTLYGLFEPNIGSLKFIRHSITPSISYNYTPDFSSPYYGYFNRVTDASGKLVKTDKFAGNPYGGTPQRESQSINMSIDNIFQAKLIDGEKETKIDLFTLNFNTGYNFKLDSLKWSDLRTSFRTTPVQGITLNLSATHSFYKTKSNGMGERNVFQWDEGHLPRLLNLSASTSFSLTSDMFKSKDEKEKEKPKTEEAINEEDQGLMMEEGIQTEVIDDASAAKNLDIPWQIGFDLNYSFNRNNIFNPVERFDIGARASITLTKNWKINWNARIDAMEKEIIYQSFSIYRDLHCWEMSFNWQPINQYYSFRINIKSSVLKDIKVTKHPSGRAYY